MWSRSCARGWPTTTSTSATRSGFDVHLPPHGVTDRLRPRVQAQLVEDVAHVELDGVLAEAEAVGQLPVRGDAVDHQLEHFALAVGERVGVGRRRRGGGFREFLQELAREVRRQRRLARAGAIEQREELLRLEVLQQITL